MIFATRFTKSEISKPRLIRKRSYRDFDPLKFLAAVRSISWWDIYSCENVEEAVSKMSGKLSFILDNMAPIKCIQVRTKYAHWMSQNIKDKIKVRDYAQKKAAETKNMMIGYSIRV